MDLRWELRTITGYLTHDAGPAIVNELLLCQRSDLVFQRGDPWRVHFFPVDLPRINHLRRGDRITCAAYPQGSPFWNDVDSPSYKRWFTCNRILNMSRPAP